MNNLSEQYYSDYEDRLLQSLARVCPECVGENGMLYGSDDIDAKWKEIGPEYMAEAVGQINEFPEAALGWAGYIGMAFAKWWDSDWSRNSLRSYSSLYGSRGFDDMDEHIVQDILGLDLNGKEAEKIESQLSSIACQAISFIRHEGTEVQTVGAYHTFTHTVNVIFRIGVSLGLKMLGYRYEKM